MLDCDRIKEILMRLLVDLCVSGHGQIECPCKDGNKYSVFIFGRIFLSNWGTVDFSMRNQFHVVTYSKDLIYRVSQNLCHKLFLGIPHPHLSKKVPINMGPKVNRFRDIDLRSCAGTRLSIT
jgi:hypothetical protein